LLPHTEVDFEFDGSDVRIVRASHPGKGGRGARLVAHLRGRGDVAMSTAEIMALTRDGWMPSVLVDSNVLLDVMTDDPHWFAYSRIVDLEEALSNTIIEREPIPYEAAFLAGKCFLAYRRRGGSKGSPLPDFFIGAHAAVAGYRLMTRDARRYRSYFPKLPLIAPD
jgi:hypothetical protein